MKWTKKYQACIKCKTTKNPHYGRGMCSICYSRNRYKNNTRYRIIHKKAVYKWMKDHPQRTREIMQKAAKKHYANNKQAILSKRRQSYRKLKKNSKTYGVLQMYSLLKYYNRKDQGS